MHYTNIHFAIFQKSKSHMKGSSFLTDENNRRRAFIINLHTIEASQKAKVLEGIIALSRKEEEKIPFDEVLEQLKKAGKLNEPLLAVGAWPGKTRYKPTTYCRPTKQAHAARVRQPREKSALLLPDVCFEFTTILSFTVDKK